MSWWNSIVSGVRTGLNVAASVGQLLPQGQGPSPGSPGVVGPWQAGAVSNTGWSVADAVFSAIRQSPVAVGGAVPVVGSRAAGPFAGTAPVQAGGGGGLGGLIRRLLGLLFGRG